VVDDCLIDAPKHPVDWGLPGQPDPGECLTADGCLPCAHPEDVNCCPPPLCGNDLCCTFVNFFQLLPSGPMWDHWKRKAIDWFQNNEDDPATCPLITDPNCPSLMLHSIYTVLKLRNVVHNALWPAFRESSPYTATTTLDWHLQKLGWEDCYAQHCRSLVVGELTPLEVWTECGPQFCPPDYPPELEGAVKRNIAIALQRIQMGVIKNLCGLNWIIDPLGAELKPIYKLTDDNPCAYLCTDKPEYTIGAKQTWIEGQQNSQQWMEGTGSGDICEMHLPRPHIPAYWDRGCDKPAGLPDRVWPGVLAAECIVRSILPPACPNNIHRIC
jgi:hypothetical protein